MTTPLNHFPQRLVGILLATLLHIICQQAYGADADTTFVYLRNGGLDAYPSEVATVGEWTSDGLQVTWHDGTIVSYAPADIAKVSHEAPAELPRLTTMKINNKYNDQVYADVEGEVVGNRVNLTVGCIGKWLTPSFQLSEEDAAAYIDGERQQSKVSRHRFDHDMTYTVAREGMCILRRRAEDATITEQVTPLHLTASQLSTNAPSNYDEGLDKVLDGDPSTFFHSTWGQGDYQKLPEDSCPHIVIHLPEAVRHVQWTMTTRSDADRMPRVIELQASNDGVAWEHVATYTTSDGLPTQPGGTFTSPTTDLGGERTSLRIIQRVASYKNYFCVAELRISKVTVGEDGPSYTYAMEPYGHDYTVHVEWLSDKAMGVPLVTINTSNGQMISSKDYYVDAEITIDGAGVFPSMDATPVHIKGRGNTSWSSNPWDKNPYRLKFDEKQKPFGLTKGKSWVLLANKQTGSMMTNAIGMKAACLTGTAGANHIIPVDLVINGQYRGSYNFTEKVGFANNSIDLDDESDAVMLELDTYYDEAYKFKSNPYNLPVNIKEPDFREGLTQLTLKDISTDFNNVMKQLSSGGEIADLIDLEYLARYLLVCDLIENYELHHPKSTFLYKEHVKSDSKYIFGPVWDLDWAYGYELHKNYFVSEQEADFYSRVRLEARQFVRDLRYVSKQLDRIYYKVWTQFMTYHLAELLDFCDDYSTFARQSFKNNQTKWGDGGNYATEAANARQWLQQRANHVYKNLTAYNLTEEELNDGTGIVNTPGDFSWQDGTMEGFADIYTLQGQCVKRHVPAAELRRHLAPGIYIVNGKKMVVK